MQKNKTYYKLYILPFVGIVAALFVSFVLMTNAKQLSGFKHIVINPIDTPEKDTTDIKLKYPFKDYYTGDFRDQQTGNLYLNNPSNVSTQTNYSADSGVYTVSQNIGNYQYKPPTEMTLTEYMEYDLKKQLKDYWKQRTHADNLNETKKNNLIPKLYIKGEVIDRIFGGNVVDIRPNGSAELIFAANVSKTDNPSLPIRQRRVATFDFNEKIQLNVIGKIGEKMKLTTNFNTEATFDFENQMKLEYTGFEDDIIKKIEAGNVSLPLTGSLITGSQSLFGVKTQMQFGKTTVTSVVSQQRGKKSEIEITGGAQTNNFEIKADNYEANRHYFLAHYFRDQYNTALANLPVVVSGVNITRVEAWVTNTTSNTNETRNIVALTDLGEAQKITHPGLVIPSVPATTLPNDSNNNLLPSTFAPPSATPPYSNLRDISTVSTSLNILGYNSVGDFEKVSLARKLSPTEFSINNQLGFISLNTQLNPDQVLAVAFQYTYNGKVYQVGEFSTDGIAEPQCLYVKLLKSTNVSTRKDSLLWDLMMKNVYAIGTYQLKPNDFKLEILYNNPASGSYVNVIPESNILISGLPLLQVMNLDKINSATMAGNPDGIFDFIEGVTINSSNGRVYLPVTEPFGEHLLHKIAGNPPNVNLLAIANKYAFSQLYDSTKTAALQFPDKNRYILRGSYKSASSSDISLNAVNIPQGSVVVTAGGIPLTENVDYTVDYAMGRVKIINEAYLKSGTPIKISLESNSLFSIQSKTFMGTRVDYRVNKDFNLGSTVIRLSERPLTQKVNIGDEPIKNTVVGFDGNYRTEAPWLTRIVDKLPLLSTKEMSTITSTFEIAKLFPGHAKAIGKEGMSYIDDFEGSQTTIDIKNFGAWTLASVPQNQKNKFPEADKTGTMSGFNRALLAWYILDPIFLRDDNNKPSHITPQDQSNNLVREILQTEIFPNKQNPSGQPINIPTLDLAYYPSDVGPYNFDTLSAYSAGLDPTGKLINPQSRWGGIMRRLETNDFEAANVEFIQFWLMDPFVRDVNGNSTDYQALFGSAPPANGELYFNLGNISEDILKDGKQSFENGLPYPGNPLPYQTTDWGRVPQIQSLVYAFSTGDDASSARTAQDVGLDGLIDADEQNHFNWYLAKWQSILSVQAYNNLLADPSHDYYHYFRGTDFDASSTSILSRYKYFNGMEANSPVDKGGDYPTNATVIPNTEDVNRDNNLTENESYYQYKIKITPQDISPTNVGSNYITSVLQANVTAKDGTTKTVNWYQFKVPVKEFLPQDRIGNIDDFRSIRFMRMYLKEFDKPIVLRFARLELVRGEWRKYEFDLTRPGEYIPNDNTSGTVFDISAVNYEENGTKSPVNYVLPPQITQEVDVQTANLVRLNEQSLSLRVCGLKDGDSRACFRNVDFDVRSYKKLRMFIHAESFPAADALNNKDLTVFVRLGTDYTDNYYEYEVPLYVTNPGVYNNNDENDRRLVWRIENDMLMAFSELQNAKQMRNEKMSKGLIGMNDEYIVTITDENGNSRNITIKGNPNLSAIKTIMVGVRNPKKINLSGSDDGKDKCAEIWINELRLTDFDENGGMASTARVTAKLADFGTVSLSGNYSTPGWGSLDKKVSERKRETVMQYDISTQLELGKFTPEKVNIRIPMFIGFSEGRINPQFNPQDPDIELKNIFNSTEFSKAYKDSIRKVTQDFTRRKSLTFTNVKKERGKGQTKQHFYDIENVSLNASYTEFYNRSFTVEHYTIKNYRGGLTYNFNPRPKNITPFAKSKAVKSKYLTLIREFNFFPYPNRMAFITDIDRYYSERLMRNITGDKNLFIDTTFEKRWNWIRSYDLGYDISRAIKFNFTADNMSQIREPDGKIDTEAEKDSIKSEFLKFGTATRYTQRSKLDWAVPINKLPMLDWVTTTASYSSSYDWSRSAFVADSLGNTIQNSNQKQLNTQFNLVSLYNKVPYFRKINQKQTQPKKNNPFGNTVQQPKDTTKNKKKDENNFEILEYIAQGIMMVKNISLSYTNSNGMIIPGYKPRSVIMGMNPNMPFGGTGYAPGLGFVFGDQRDPREQLVADSLFSKAFINTPFTKTKTENINGRANVEPIKGFRIEINANRNQSKNFSENFRYDDVADDFLHLNPNETGSFSMSFLSHKTAFEKRKDDNNSEVFQKFLNSRATFSDRLHQENSNNSTTLLPTGFWNGYGSTSQQVLMFSFLSAYSGSNENTYSLSTFPKIPKPNWRVSYDGLSKVSFVKKYFKAVNISHAYRSSLSFNYQTNLRYLESNGGASATDAVGNFINREQISSVSISEQFSPLIKIDATLNNQITTNFEMKRDRNIALGFSNNQVTEVNGKEYIIGAGYRIPNLKIAIKKFKLNSDLVLRADLSIRNNRSVIRKVVEQVSQPVAGQKIIAIKFSADYVLSQKLNLRVFYDQTLTRPAISTSFNSSNINSGISIRFSLSQ